MASIFVSYSRADRQFIDQLIPLIHRVYGNDSLWFDDEIHGGIDWWQMILDEIEKCDIFVYLISNESLESPYCQAELREALRLKKQILPVIVYRLSPAYPGSIEPDLAAVLRRTQYVDMSGGFRDPNTIAALYAALNRLLNAVPHQPPSPVTSAPTPEPPVPDKKKSDRAIRPAYMVGAFVLAAAVIAGIFALLRENSANVSSTTEPTTAVAQNVAETPADAFTPTLSGFQQLQTTEAELTQSAATQAAFELTLTEQFISDSNATATAAQFAATETAAFVTLLALSATPTPSHTPTATPTNTPDPLAVAFVPVTRNADWEPIERDFDDVTMVLVPAGCFMMGSTQQEADEQIAAGINPEWVERQLPQHEQCFDTPFWIDKYEVTQAQFRRLGGTQADTPFYHGADRPVENITWFEARDFCALRDSRLPTEAEWEYAARGPDGLIFPWGNEWNADNAVWNRTSSQGTANVGSIPAGASWVGALDMIGNVREWTSSLYADYPYDAADGREADTGASTDVERVLRGGPWYEGNTTFLRATLRLMITPGGGYDYYGLRCARSYDAPSASMSGETDTLSITRNADWTPVQRDFAGVAMVLVPAGCFDMGSTSYDDEQPVHQQCFDQPFWIDKYEVTQAQFRRLGGTQADAPVYPGDDHPVENITWFEARDFCALRGAYLPTEPQWEYAARGPDGLIFPWGNDWNEDNAVWNRSDSQGTVNVGSIPAGASWVGALDMSGNVREWTSSLYAPYPYDAADGREADTGSSAGVDRVVRGGSWYYNESDLLRAAIRAWDPPDNGYSSYGFRCARADE